MAAIANVFNSLKNEFEEAKTGLKDVDDNIKRLTGREPGANRGKGFRRGSQGVTKAEDEPEEGEITTDEPIPKKRVIGSAFSRVHNQTMSRRQMEVQETEEPEDTQKKPTLQSSVIAFQKEVKPRHQAIEEQKNDKKNMARNKRMFGMILGTLQQFQSEESRRKETTQKRVEIEKKLEKAAADEKELVKKQRVELFKIRRDKQAQIRRIELKMERVQSHQDWEKSQQFLGGFIQTKTKPHIFYMPVKHIPETEKRLKETKDKYRLIVAEKRAKVQKELTDIDEAYKKENVEEMENEEMCEEAEATKEKNGNNGDTNAEMEVELDSVGNSNSVEGETGETIVKSESNETNPIKDISDDVPESVEISDLGDKEFEPIYDD